MLAVTPSRLRLPAAAPRTSARPHRTYLVHSCCNLSWTGHSARSHSRFNLRRLHLSCGVLFTLPRFFLYHFAVPPRVTCSQRCVALIITTRQQTQTAAMRTARFLCFARYTSSRGSAAPHSFLPSLATAPSSVPTSCAHCAYRLVSDLLRQRERSAQVHAVHSNHVRGNRARVRGVVAWASSLSDMTRWITLALSHSSPRSVRKHRHNGTDHLKRNSFITRARTSPLAAIFTCWRAARDLAYSGARACFSSCLCNARMPHRCTRLARPLCASADQQRLNNIARRFRHSHRAPPLLGTQ